MTYTVRQRSGHTEHLCGTCSRWYWRLVSHLRRFHGWRHDAKHPFEGMHRNCGCRVWREKNAWRGRSRAGGDVGSRRVAIGVGQ